MNRWIRFAAALLLIATLPAKAWAAVAMPLCAADSAVGVAAMAAPVSTGAAAAVPPQAMTPEHCADHVSQGSTEERSHPVKVDCSTCGFCHLACSSFLAPPPAAALDDLLRPVLNAGTAGADLSVPAAHAPPPPRA